MKRSLQEEFWAGDFGDEYVERNSGSNLLITKLSVFRDIMRHTDRIESICELGANIGLNLIALHTLLPHAELHGVEINKKAAAQLAKLSYVSTTNCSIYELPSPPLRKYDLVFTAGVLIHQNPELLPDAYDVLYNTSKRYIMVSEYYNPTPVEVAYRGNSSVLFKRDFAGEIMDRYPALKLIDYGFMYHRDKFSDGDDFNWFLMEKKV